MNANELLDEVIRYARGMWRFRWWALLVAWLLAIAGSLFVLTLPNQYEATAKVYVDTETLMDPIFKDIVVANDIGSQIDAVSRTLLTRPNLRAVAVETDLHLLVDSEEEMENLITTLQQMIRIRGDRRTNVFDIALEYSDRQKAFEVVSALVDGFVEGSLREQGDDAQVTLKAVEAEIEQHGNRLNEAEERLAEFKKANVGFMPNDRGDYYSRLQSAMDELDDTQSRINALIQRANALESQLNAETSALDNMTSGGTMAIGCSQEAQISELESQLAALQVDFTERHPRIVSLRDNIATLRERCSAEVQAARAAGVRPPSSGDGSLEANTLYENLRIMQADTEIELATLRAELEDQQAGVSELRLNVDKIADVERNLKQLNRDYDVVQERYQLLIARRENLRSKLRIDPVKDISFRILEPPFASTDPSGPPRALLLIGVLVAASGVAAVIAFGLNELNPVFFSRKDVTRFAGLPVLGSISLISTPAQRRSSRIGQAVWYGGCAFLVVAIGILVAFSAEGASLLQDLIKDAGV